MTQLLKQIKFYIGALVLVGIYPIEGLASGKRALEEVIVVAQKRAERMQDVPISMNVMNELVLAEQNINAVTDIARLEPSLSFQRGFAAHSNNLAMRGVTSYSLEGGIQPSVSLVLDGVPLFRAGEFESDLADIARVEILKGPQGTFFGKNSTGGALNVVRNRPSDEFEGQVDVSFTTDEEKLLRMMVNSPLTESISGRVAAFYKHRPGHIENTQPGVGDHGGEDNWGMSSKLLFDFSEDTNLLLTFEYRDSDTGLGAQITKVNTVPQKDAIVEQSVFDDPFKTKTNGETINDSENWAITSEFNWNISDTVALTSITAYRDFFAETHTDIDSSPASGTNPQDVPVVHISQSNINRHPDTEPTATNSVRYLTQDLRIEYVTDSLRWVVGGFYQGVSDHFRGEVVLLASDAFVISNLGVPLPASTGEYFAITTHPVSTTDIDSYAIYTDVTKNFGDSFEVFGGFRWTEEEGEIDHSRPDIVVPASEPCFRTTDTFATFTPDAVGCVPLTNEVTEFVVNEQVGDWSGRLGGKWYISEDTNIYTSLSRSFVGVGFDSGRNASKEKTTLAPTTSEAFEIGLKSLLFENTLRFNIAVFAQRTTNLQISRLIPGTINAETINAGDIDAQGAEVSLAWQITDRLSVSGSGSWIDAKIQNLTQSCYIEQDASDGCNLDLDNDGTPESQDVAGKQATLTPEFSFTLTPKYEVSLSSLPFNVVALANYSWKDDVQYSLTHSPELVQEAYGLLDVSLGLNHQEGRFDMAIFGTNVTDKEWQPSIDEATGVIGRVYVRTPRGAQAYWGIKGTYRF